MEDRGKTLKRVKEVQGHTEVHSVMRRDTGRRGTKGVGGAREEGLAILHSHSLAVTPNSNPFFLPKEN